MGIHALWLFMKYFRKISTPIFQVQAILIKPCCTEFDCTENWLSLWNYPADIFPCFQPPNHLFQYTIWFCQSNRFTLWMTTLFKFQLANFPVLENWANICIIGTPMCSPRSENGEMRKYSRIGNLRSQRLVEPCTCKSWNLPRTIRVKQRHRDIVFCITSA